ncbi:MAG: Ig-like domain-containing protein [Candidatus Marinimicrobia bacterium]|nr:Ig-like domain-containing protein [Candidatus Neomarinimicrobiota bacterium]
MKRLYLIFICFLISLSPILSQTWSSITLGQMGDYSPMIVADQDGYIHFGNAHVYGNTTAIDPNTTSGTLDWHSWLLPGFDGSYFPVMRIQNNTPHMAFRTYGGGTGMGVLYWTPEYGDDNWDVYFDWHGHYPGLEVDSDGTQHIWYQVDAYGASGQETNIIYTNSDGGSTQRMVPDTLDCLGMGGLYDFTTVIDNQDNLHWLGAVFNQKAGPGRKLYYNHSVSGVFQDAQRLPWDGAFPSMAVDDNNVIHAVWQNGDIQYSYNDGSGWADAESVNTPGDSLQKYWVWQQVSDDNLQDMRPVSGHLNWAWACGNWGIFMTNDNWNSFDIQYVDGSGHLGIYPVDSVTVYSVGTNGRYWKTVNGGLVYESGADGWTEYSTGYTQDLYDCWFHDELNGIAVGDGGLIIKTSDGGLTWATITSGVGAILRSIDFPTPSTGYIVGKAGKVLKTTDGGNTWAIISPGTTRNLWDVCALNADTLWITGGTATVRVSYDGGSTWVSKNSVAASYLNMGYSIHFFNENVGYLAGTSSDINNEQKIFKTTDGGTSWVATTPLTGQDDTAPIRGLYAIAEDTIFAAGGIGKIFKGVKSTDADYKFPGIAIDQNGYAHVAYWGWINFGWDRAIYYNNNIGGTWGNHQQVAQSAYLAQIDGGSRVALDFNTNTIYIGGLAVLSGKLFYTRDINIRAATTNETTSLAVASSTLIEPEYIHVGNVGENNRLSVFDFTLTDIGGDGLSTSITDLCVRKGPEATSSLSYEDALGGARLYWGSDSCDATHIERDFIAFGDSVSTLINVSDGNSLTFTLKTWLQSPDFLDDGDVFDFKISAAHDVHVDNSGSFMSIEPSDITSGAITFQLVPSELIIGDIPESVWFGSDYSFEDAFTVTAVDDSGNIVVTAESSDLTLSHVGLDGISPAMGTLTVSPASPPDFVNGIAIYNNIIFSDAHQYVRIKATGTVNGRVVTGLSDTIKIIPNDNIIVIDGNQETILTDVLTRLGLGYDTHFGWHDDPLPDNILNDYDKVLVSTSVDRDDFTAIKQFLDSGSFENKKKIGFFCANSGTFYGTTPWLSILAPYAGVSLPTFYPWKEIDPIDTDNIYGIVGDIIGNSLSVDLNENDFSWDNCALSPATDSSNIRVAFETTMHDVGYYHDNYDFRVPVTLRHTGTHYKFFTSGFYLNYYGDNTDRDTLVARMFNWFDSDEAENYGCVPGFSSSLTAKADDRYTVYDLDTMIYTATFFDLDASETLTSSVIVCPSWLNYTTYTDSLCFNGIPQVSDVGDTLLHIEIRDELGNYSLQTTRIRISHKNHAPYIISAPFDTARVGSIYTQQLEGFDADTLEGDELTYSMINLNFLPSSNTPKFSSALSSPLETSTDWLSLAETGTLSGTPGISDIGMWSGVLIVEDSFGLMDSLDFWINVLPGINHVPIADTLHVSGAEDIPVSFTLTGSDADDDSLTFIITRQPEFGSLNGIPPELSYTPDNDWYGEDSLSFIVNDGLLNSDTAMVWFTVTSSDDHIQITSLLPSSFSIDVVETDTVHFSVEAIDPDGFSLSYAWRVETSLVSTNASFDFITDFIDDYDAGSYTVTLNIDDNYVGNVAQQVPMHTLDYTWAVTVENLNRPPVTDDQLVEMFEDTTIAISLHASDPDLDSLSFSQIISPLHGQISGAWPSVNYTPVMNWFGRDTITCTVSDGELFDTSNIYILVRPINDPPNAVTLLSPAHTANIVLTPDNINDTLRFSWSEPQDPDFDVLYANMLFTSGVSPVATLELHESNNSAWITHQILTTLMDTVSQINGEWNVLISDGEDSTLSVNGPFSLSIDNSALVSIYENAYLPDDFALYQNYPNPFNPITTIRFDLPLSGKVNLSLYNILGHTVRCLLEDHLDAGSYEFHLDASDLPTGTYFYSISSGDFNTVKKMVLIK